MKTVHPLITVHQYAVNELGILKVGLICKSELNHKLVSVCQIVYSTFPGFFALIIFVSCVCNAKRMHSVKCNCFNATMEFGCLQRYQSKKPSTRQPENHQFLIDALSGYQSTLKNLKFIDAYKITLFQLPLNLEITITIYNLNLIWASNLERADFQV